MPQTTYTAHATMRNGTARQVVVKACDAIEARRQFFKLFRPASITAPKVAS